MIIKKSDFRGPKGLVVISGASFATALVIGLLGVVPLPRLDVVWRGTSADAEPVAAMETGPELALIYIGSSTCYWSNVDLLPSLLREIKTQLRERAQSTGYYFASIGIARDRNVESGLRHLRKMGPFDEVMTGRGWLNIGVLKYVFEDLPGPAATPQVLVVKRQLYRELEATEIRSEEILVRKVGVAEIEAWVQQGMPLPTIAAL